MSLSELVRREPPARVLAVDDSQTTLASFIGECHGCRGCALRVQDSTSLYADLGRGRFDQPALNRPKHPRGWPESPEQVAAHPCQPCVRWCSPLGLLPQLDIPRPRLLRRRHSPHGTVSARCRSLQGRPSPTPLGCVAGSSSAAACAPQAALDFLRQGLLQARTPPKAALLPRPGPVVSCRTKPRTPALSVAVHQPSRNCCAGLTLRTNQHPVALLALQTLHVPRIAGHRFQPADTGCLRSQLAGVRGGRSDVV